MATVAPIKPVQQIAEDDGVREHHGLTVGEKSVRVCEHIQWVVLYATYHDLSMTPRQARYLARRLYWLARRIERREVGQ